MTQLDLPLTQPCPCCGGSGEIPWRLELAVTGIIRRRLVKILLERPQGANRDELYDLIYGMARNDGPNSKTIDVIVYHANRQLRPLGYEIRILWRGRGSRRILRKIDADPVSQPARDQNPRTLGWTEPTGAARFD